MDVKVWNDNEYPFTQAFKGVEVSIAPKQFIKMERGEATDFLGLFSPIVRDADGAPHPKSYKKLRVEEIASRDK